MSLFDFIFKEQVTPRRIRKIEADLLHKSRADRNSRIRANERIEALEEDLGRAALVLRALMEACVKKGVVTPDELLLLMKQADLADGAADGKLDPKRLRS